MSGTAVELPEGLVAVVKADCPTCTLVRPVLDGLTVHVISEDDPEGLDASYALGVETVPTLLRVEGGREVERLVGWDRSEWRRMAGEFGGVAHDGDGAIDQCDGGRDSGFSAVGK